MSDIDAPSLKLSFAGAPDFAADILQSLAERSPHTISRVYTQPDRPRGRGRKTLTGPVKALAARRGIPVLQPATPKELALAHRDDDSDALVVAAYGLLLPPEVLSRPRYGCVNAHASLLPRWRGAAPVARAIQAGDAQTGVSIMLMDAGLDTGKILGRRACDIAPDETSASLLPRLARLGSACLLEALAALATGRAQPEEQDSRLATYAKKITKDEAEIDWRDAAEQVARNIRAFNPTPVAFATLNGVKLRIWRGEPLSAGVAGRPPGAILAYTAQGLDVAAQDRPVRILELQAEGRTRQSVRAFYHGRPRLFEPVSGAADIAAATR